MWSLFCLYLIVATAGQVHGIQLSITAVNTDVEDDSLPCAKVRCIEGMDPSIDESIKSLTMRKKLKDNVILVELSQQQPTFDSNVGGFNTDGIWAKGTWKSHRAEAHITLYNSEDCSNAEFICEIVHLDKHGVEHTSSHSGRVVDKLNQQVKSSLAELETKLSTILSRLQLTTCLDDPSTPHDNRYQIVHPLDRIPPYLCDTHGGWTIIQRRINAGNINFYTDWANYKEGFGEVHANLWLGLERIYRITSSSHQELMITLKFEGKLYHAHYHEFKLSGEDDNYKLFIGKYTGDAGDALRYHNTMPFTTHDKDNDNYARGNCASRCFGGWWYNNCNHSNLNGYWGDKGESGVRWSKLSTTKSVTITEMKIRKIRPKVINYL